jgi:putative transposase
MDIYRQNAHERSVGWSTWHLEWCTKYRLKIFVTAQLRELCLIAICDAARQHHIGVIDAECDRDHVHVIAALPLTMPPTAAIQVLKSKSARIILHQAPHVRRLYRGKGLWSPGKFMASVGHITLEKAKQYVEAHHAKRAPVQPQGIPAPTRSGGVAPKARELAPGRTSIVVFGVGSYCRR